MKISNLGKSAYFIGIKGVGMTMLAQFLAGQGIKITGADNSEVFMTDAVLRRAKIKVLSPFAIKNIPAQVDFVVYSSAYSEKNNVEMKEARRRGLKMYCYAEALGWLFNSYQGISVCGSHGKTTTTAWLGYVLSRAGKSPNVLVGARVPQFKGSALLGKSKLFVAESDEYQNKLQYFSPRGVLLNNIDYDHPDFFSTEKDYIRVFAEFIKKIPRSGFLVANLDDQKIKSILKYNPAKLISYSLVDSQADYYAQAISLNHGQQSFLVYKRGRLWGKVKTKLTGKHNISNALAVIAAAEKLGVKKEQIIKGLFSFQGTERRLQTLGVYHGAKIIDDYGHHPTEIKATLMALRNLYPQKRLLVLFHPHTFTRTKALFKDFSNSFREADQVFVLNIYGSAREKQGGVSAKDLAAAINIHSQVPAKHIKDLAAAVKYLRIILRPQDLLLLLGAGDVFRVGQELIYGKRK
ncbi:MAG TPA: UDP-N-acetylmuramate--L-alanine ligase [bacterium]|nr:UDP-N-acetylmuramate--L-alanine ligase [bacterium]HPT29964.1 UDP-N-acetylmuramate--L-alanine ligase [bacterium]